MPDLITWWTQDVAALTPGADPREVAATGTELLRRWGEAYRRYHSTRHLVEVFWALEDLTDAGAVTEAEAILGRVAAWLHDAEYHPLAAPGANEAASADLAAVLLPRVGLDERVVACVVDLVRMTSDHAMTKGSALQRAFHDADLWILASPHERFDDYCVQVREEYVAVPDDAYRVGRSAILRNLAASGGVYRTPYAQEHWEQPARANLTRELARLA